MSDEHDTSKDAAQVASEERASEGAINLTEEETLRRLGGGSYEEDVEEGSLSDESEEQPTDRSHPNPTAEDADHADEGSLSEDEADATETESTDNSGTEATDAEETPGDDDDDDDDDDGLDIGDIFLGVDDEGGLSLSAQDTPAPTDTDTKAPDAPSLTNDERVQLWQGKYDQTQAKLVEAEKRLHTAEATITDLRTQVTKSTHQPEAFTKSPKDFMETGEDWIPEDRDEPGTPSYRAYRAYGDAYRTHEKEQWMSEVEAKREAKEAQKAAENSAVASVEFLRTKRPKQYATDASVEGLVEWSKGVGTNGLYYLSLARDLAQGKLPLSRKAVERIIANAKRSPKSASGADKPVTKHKTSEPEPPKHVDSDRKLLNKYFVDA